MGQIVLLRHGETAWSASHRHTSYTDLPLTERGEAQSRALADAIGARTFAAVFTSPRTRASRTAELAGLPVNATLEDLVEWNYGEYEGLTTATIRQSRPGWLLWRDGCPGGEAPEQVSTRIDRVLARVRPELDHGDVALVGHGHALRVTAARWIGLPASGGGMFRLDVGRISTLGYERELPVLLGWNCPV
ncbi:MAG: histidine phosphatase family protein [Micromonosporaceae bacterium]